MINLAEKKLSSRFCIQFNSSDSRHLQVMDILNAQGRHKAGYITTAVLHYINCTATPIEFQNNAALRQAVQEIFQELITTQNSGTPILGKRDMSEQFAASEESNHYDSDMLNAIRSSVSSFRRENN